MGKTHEERIEKLERQVRRLLVMIHRLSHMHSPPIQLEIDGLPENFKKITFPSLKNTGAQPDTGCIE